MVFRNRLHSIERERLPRREGIVDIESVELVKKLEHGMLEESSDKCENDQDHDIRLILPRSIFRVEEISNFNRCVLFINTSYQKEKKIRVKVFSNEILEKV